MNDANFAQANSGLLVPIQSAAVAAVGAVESDRTAFGVIREPFSGAWQRNISTETNQNLLGFSVIYACVWRIASDVAKMRIKLMEDPDGDDVWEEVRAGSPFLPVLRKPNRYQTRQQFLEYWMVSKLLFGNTYILKERDQRGVVIAHYPLDPRRVTPYVAEDGDVYYALRSDKLAQVALDDGDRTFVPASEIMHDRMMPCFHPLCGIPPIYAAAMSSTQGIKIQANSQQFFANQSRPSGQLTAPGRIDKETALRLKEEFERGYSGANIGRLLVTGDGLKYEPMTVPADQAQLSEQLKWTAEDACRPFGVPLHKVGLGPSPTIGNQAAQDQDYYSQTLHQHVEAIETLHEEGLGLTPLGYQIEMDTENLLRMDPVTQMEVLAKAGGIMKVNEQRNKLNLPKVSGGDSVYLQQQNFSLDALAKRDAQPDPFGTKQPKPAAEPAPARAELPWDEAADDFIRALDADQSIEIIATSGATAAKETLLLQGVMDIGERVNGLAEIMKMPTRAIHDDKGRIVGAERVSEL